MPRDASPLELTYESFEQFWKALVSKRKARRLDVDVASAWRQLSEGGAGAAFLRLHAASKATKAERKHAEVAGEPGAAPPSGTHKEPETAQPAADTQRAAGRKTPPSTKPRARKKTGTKRGATKKAATGSKRGADTKSAKGAQRGARRKATRR